MKNPHAVALGSIKSKKKAPVASKTALGRMKRKKLSRGSWVKNLDSIFSKWVRLSNADQYGAVKCYTCPKRLHWKLMQNGHYVSRSVRVSRWNPDNCRPQCYGCNIMHGGQPITFRENLIKELGLESVEFLEASRWTIFKPQESWIEEQIALYEGKMHTLSLTYPLA